MTDVHVGPTSAVNGNDGGGLSFSASMPCHSGKLLCCSSVFSLPTSGAPFLGMDTIQDKYYCVYI